MSLSQPPPWPPLFPYTTLFRSLAHRRDEDVVVAEEVDHPLVQRRAVGVGAGDARPGQGLAGADVVGQRRLERVGVGDRKSTRLNSSHVEISYAVFCLKKKTLCD